MNKQWLVMVLLISSSVFAANVDDRIDIASRTADAALKRLKSAMLEQMSNEGTPEKAIPFCHVSAQPMTAEEISGRVVDVRRATLKTRNSKNLASKTEAGILRRWSTLQEKGEKIPEYETAVEKNLLHYYRPLKIEAMCLACHGAEATLSPGVVKILKEKYPNDKATGYQEGDLRGMIHVVVKK